MGTYVGEVQLRPPDSPSTDPRILDVAMLAGYTHIEGGLSVDGDVDLRPLRRLQSIREWFVSFHRDLPLDGLDRLETVGGTLQIDSNNAMPHLRPLSRLTSIGVLSVSGNEALTSLDGLSGLRTIGSDVKIAANPAMISLDGLQDVVVAGGISILARARLPDRLHVVAGKPALRTVS